jgi:hypothetical protein
MKIAHIVPKIYRKEEVFTKRNEEKKTFTVTDTGNGGNHACRAPDGTGVRGIHEGRHGAAGR